MLGPGGRARKYARAGAQRLYSTLAANSLGAVLREVAISDGLARSERVRHGNTELRFAALTGLTKWRAKTFSTKEPGTLAWIDGFNSGDTFWDVGANVGLYAIYAAVARKCSVLAFEPSVSNLECLTRNINLNGVQDQVAVVPNALSDREGFQDFRMSTVEWGGHFLDLARCRLMGGQNLTFSSHIGHGARH